MENIDEIVMSCLVSYMEFKEIFVKIAKGDWSKFDLLLDNHPEAREKYVSWQNREADFRNAISAGNIFSHSGGIIEGYVQRMIEIEKKSPFSECSVHSFLERQRDQREDEIEQGWVEDDGIVNAIDAIFELPNFDLDKWLERKFLTRGARISSSIKPPDTVNKRFREVHSCYIYGNFLAAIAMSRSVIEFILKDKYKDAFRNVGLGDIIGKKWYVISELKRKKRSEEIRGKAKSINETAIRVMHVKNKISDIFSDRLARKVLDDLRDVIEFIYS